MPSKTPQKFEKIGIITKSNIISTPEKMAFLRNVVSLLQKSKKKIYLDEHSAGALKAKSGYSIDELFTFCDLLIVMGGDGTLLKTASHAGSQKLSKKVNQGPLIFGVNLGNLGFLTETSPSTFTQDLNSLLDGKFTVDSRELMEITLERTDEKSQQFIALNDAVINQGFYARLASMEVEISAPKMKSQKIATFRADGLIISTPTGSTGHSLSAGGPIVYPSLPAFILTPICPATLSVRPIVIPNDEEISIKLNSKLGGIQEIGLTLDGQKTIQLQCCDVIKIRKASQDFHLVRLKDNQNYYEILRTKLHWGGHNQ